MTKLLVGTTRIKPFPGHTAPKMNSGDLFAFTKEILNGKLHFCSVSVFSLIQTEYKDLLAVI